MVLVQKLPFFQSFFLSNISQENVFYNILEQKNACLGYKNKMLKKSKNWHFSKGVTSWFWSKNGHYYNFFFVEYSSGKVLLRYCTTKKRRCRLWKQEIQKVKNLTFFESGSPMVLVQKWPLFQTFFFAI